MISSFSPSVWVRMWPVHRMIKNPWPSSTSTTPRWCTLRRSPNSWRSSVSSGKRVSRGKVSPQTLLKLLLGDLFLMWQLCSYIQLKNVHVPWVLILWGPNVPTRIKRLLPFGTGDIWIVFKNKQHFFVIIFWFAVVCFFKNTYCCCFFYLFYFVAVFFFIYFSVFVVWFAVVQ